jgi:hypothetical protein
MTGHGTARGHVIPTFARHTMAATSPPEKVQIHEDALPEGATLAEKAAIMRGLVIRHPHGTVGCATEKFPCAERRPTRTAGMRVHGNKRVAHPARYMRY